MKKIIIEAEAHGEGFKIGISHQGFINKVDVMCALLAAFTMTKEEVARDLAEHAEEYIKRAQEDGYCSCPACETKRSMQVQ